MKNIQLQININELFIYTKPCILYFPSVILYSFHVLAKRTLSASASVLGAEFTLQFISMRRMSAHAIELSYYRCLIQISLHPLDKLRQLHIIFYSKDCKINNYIDFKNKFQLILFTIKLTYFTKSAIT